MQSIGSPNPFVRGRWAANGIMWIEPDHAALEAHTERLGARAGVRVRYSVAPTGGCATAHADICELRFDPACANETVLQKGADATEVLLRHEIGHLVHCDIGGTLEKERRADWYAATWLVRDGWAPWRVEAAARALFGSNLGDRTHDPAWARVELMANAAKREHARMVAAHQQWHLEQHRRQQQGRWQFPAVAWVR